MPYQPFRTKIFHFRCPLCSIQASVFISTTLSESTTHAIVLFDFLWNLTNLCYYFFLSCPGWIYTPLSVFCMRSAWPSGGWIMAEPLGSSQIISVRQLLRFTPIRANIFPGRSILIGHLSLSGNIVVSSWRKIMIFLIILHLVVIATDHASGLPWGPHLGCVAKRCFFFPVDSWACPQFFDLCTFWTSAEVAVWDHLCRLS